MQRTLELYFHCSNIEIQKSENSFESYLKESDSNVGDEASSVTKFTKSRGCTSRVFIFEFESCNHAHQKANLEVNQTPHSLLPDFKMDIIF